MRRIAPLFALALLSAFTAEFLLGDQYLSPAGVIQQIAMVILYMAFYGTAAIIIREVTRRLGRGWPTMLIMAFGFGVLEEGLITQSLFNPHYLGLDLLRPAFVPALGIGLQWTVFVITLHVVWSMSAPIALFEGIFGSAPRLRRIGLVVTSVIFVLGAAATFALNLMLSPTRFLASPVQLGVTAVIVVAAVVVALRLPRRAVEIGTPATAVAPLAPVAPVAPVASLAPLAPLAPVTGKRVLAGVVVGLASTTAFELLGRGLSHVPDWLPVVAMLVSLALGAVVAGRLRLPPAALAVGAILTYAWVGLRAALQPHLSVDVIEQSVIVAAYLVLIVFVLRRSRRLAEAR